MANKTEKVSVNDKITDEKIKRYLSVTAAALKLAKPAFNLQKKREAEDFYDLAERYYSDALYFYEKKHDLVLAFAAVNYSHGWLDAGARIGLFLVKDSKLFTVDS
jgi:hypothetical protein